MSYKFGVVGYKLGVKSIPHLGLRCGGLLGGLAGREAYKPQKRDYDAIHFEL